MPILWQAKKRKNIPHKIKMEDLEKYIHNYSDKEEELLIELDRATHHRMVAPRMISGHIQGKFLQILTATFKPKRVLEIGTFTGYSALLIAAGLSEDAVLDTFEVDDEQEEFIESFFNRSKHGRKIRLHIGSFLELAKDIQEPYDMVFIDGDKREYPDYYRTLMGDFSGKRLVSSGTLIIADNILWYGKVAEAARHGDRHTEALQEFNRMVLEDDRVENVILPLRDGLNIIRVK